MDGKLFEFQDIEIEDIAIKKYPNLKITESSPSYYLILRGIFGELKLKQIYRSEEFVQNINYLNPYTQNTSIELSNSESEQIIDEEINISQGKIDESVKNKLTEVISLLKNKSRLSKLEKFFEEDYSLEDLSITLSNRVTNNRNKSFYNNLLNEYSNFFYNTQAKNHTLAFLHLYRILEYTSYTFPLIYSLNTKDYVNSFENLRTLFSGDKDKGELKVFKEFIFEIFGRQKYFEKLSIDIDIVADLPEYTERIYKTLISICDNDIFESAKNVENKKVSIKFVHFSSFIITIRNRFFHLKNSQSNNMHSIDIVDANHFFSLINTKCAYFLSLVTFEVIKKSNLTR